MRVPKMKTILTYDDRRKLASTLTPVARRVTRSTSSPAADAQQAKAW